MKPTLEKYIDPANIPKKYGGQLDFEFGMMPVLEPAIENALNWDKPAIQGGHRTIPTGPIKWEESSNGKVTAWAVGTENKKLRREVVAELVAPVSIKAMHGSLVTSNIPIAEEELALTTVGTATQPPDSAIVNIDEELTDDLKDEPTAETLPIRENKAQENRAGTSDTRFEQQGMTHAQGQLAEGTPVVRDNGFGDKTTVIEPSTVGQAPKDVSIPPAEEPAPGYLAQAKGAVGSAAGAVAGVVGVRGKKEETKVEEVVEKTEGQEDDRRIDAAPTEAIEGVLRDQTSTAKSQVKPKA
jgi:hypothetical protein